jgi:hypothetical protein
LGNGIGTKVPSGVFAAHITDQEERLEEKRSIRSSFEREHPIDQA